MQLSMHIDYAGDHEAAAARVVELESAGIDMVWVAEAYGFDAVCYIATYLQLPNSNDVSNWRRAGFGEDDFADGGSDGLLDHVVAWGDEAAIAARVQAQLDAGADHVCVQVVTGAERTDFPLVEWRALAAALVGLARR